MEMNPVTSILFSHNRQPSSGKDAQDGVKGIKPLQSDPLEHQLFKKNKLTDVYSFRCRDDIKNIPDVKLTQVTGYGGG